MKVQDLSPQMRLSHIRARIWHFNDRFLLMPFQFFGEKELHYEFSRDLNGLRSGSRDASRYAEMKIIREFPTSHLFKRGKNGILEESPTGKRCPGFEIQRFPRGPEGKRQGLKGQVALVGLSSRRPHFACFCPLFVVGFKRPRDVIRFKEGHPARCIKKENRVRCEGAL